MTASVIVRGGMVVADGGVIRADVAIDEGRISAVGDGVAGGREEIDARGLHVMPAAVDVHLHFNEPGRTGWEGAATGSRALAAGGGALFFDMPLNSTPCTVTPEEFDRKHAALSAASVTDFGIWGGLVPGAVTSMAAMADRGVVGFKAFMCDSGLPEFPRADDRTLLDGMHEAARLGLPVAVHAESEELTRSLAATLTGSGVRDFLSSRPIVAELEAIQRALLFAGESGVQLHIVHMSCGRAVAMAAEARATRGVDVSIETCPHYLSFTDEDMERLGAVAKCAPPLRSDGDRRELWAQLMAGRVDIVASDHSPTEPANKEGDFLHAWGGVAGVQSTFAVLLDEGHFARGLSLDTVARLLAEKPARRFGITSKGSIAVGKDADLVLLDLQRSRTLQVDDLHQRHKTSPYLGRTFRGVVCRTIRRGETIFLNGRVTSETTGRLVRPHG